MIAKREILHQIIDDLSESQLTELAEFVEILLAQDKTDRVDVEVPTHPVEQPNDLSAIIQIIKNTPPNPQAITPPTKTWADIADQIPQSEEPLLNVAAWNERWDRIEREMEATSLAHEAAECQAHEE